MLQVERVQPNSSSGVSDQASGMQRYTVIRQGFFKNLSLFVKQQNRINAKTETVYCRRPGLPGHLEQPAGQRDISPVSVNLPSAFKNISVSGLIP